MEPREKTDEAVLPLTGHLAEFRRRLIYCLAALALASGASYAYIEDIIAFISAPAGKLYFMQPAEVFFSYLQVAVCTGFLVTVPVWAYQLWRFVRPALTGKERRGVFLSLVLLVLSRLGLVTPQGLRRKRKAFIVLDFIFAAVISPTGDAFTQMMIALPVLILYEGSILVMKWLDKGRLGSRNYVP